MDKIGKFGIGDKVLIVARTPPNLLEDAYGFVHNKRGSIVKIRGRHSVIYTVEIEDITFDFYEKDLDWVPSDLTMTEPDFSLEEIELGRNLVEEMNG